MHFFSLWATMFINVGPNEALMSYLTKVSEINKKQTAESEDSNDPALDLELDSDGPIKSFIFEAQCGSSSEKEEREEQELVIGCAHPSTPTGEGRLRITGDNAVPRNLFACVYLSRWRRRVLKRMCDIFKSHVIVWKNKSRV